MPKKIVILLVVLACFSLACLCIPTELVSFIEYQFQYTPTRQPPTLQPAVAVPHIQPDDTLYSGDIDICVSSLEDVLHEAENASRPGQELVAEYTLVTYSVYGDALSEASYASVPPQVAEYQEQDDTRYREIWQFVTDVIPLDQRTQVSEFVLYTDGVGGSLGAVEQGNDPQSWLLELDSEDSAYFPELSTTLIHEFAHMLTLNDSQITTDDSVFYNPDDEQLYEDAVNSCSTYFLFEGCSNNDSYMTAFYDSFWPDIYYEWLDLNDEEDQDVLDENLDAFYQEYADQFVSSYAVTSPEEDIAESFMYFIFTARPDGYTISSQKILFFYAYPELVSLRERILSNLCTYVE